MPSVTCLNVEVAKWAADYAANKTPDSDTRHAKFMSADFYGLLQANREDYVGLESSAIYASRIEPNFERIMGDLHLLMNAVLEKPFGDPLLRFVASAKIFHELGITFDFDRLDRNRPDRAFYAVHDQLQCLYEQLAKRVRTACVKFEQELANDIGRKCFAPCRRLLAGLSDEFEVGVYNLNYDTVALNALPGSFVGFDPVSGGFLASEVHGREQWDFIYHLHGSVHHFMDRGSGITSNPDHGSKVVWREALAGEWMDVRGYDTRSDGKRMLMTSLIAGGWKLDQLQLEPYLTFYSSLPRHAYMADAILIAGYGFGDAHVNSILKNVLRTKASSSKRPPVLVLDYDASKQVLAKRNDAWIGGLAQTLRVARTTFRSVNHRFQSQWMELPADHPEVVFEKAIDDTEAVSVWTGGFCAAAGKLPEITAWLNGGRAAF